MKKNKIANEKKGFIRIWFWDVDTHNIHIIDRLSTHVSGVNRISTAWLDDQYIWKPGSKDRNQKQFRFHNITINNKKTSVNTTPNNNNNETQMDDGIPNIKSSASVASTYQSSTPVSPMTHKNNLLSPKSEDDDGDNVKLTRSTSDNAIEKQKSGKQQQQLPYTPQNKFNKINSIYMSYIIFFMT